jgi:Tfp pilus assembly protein PilX
MNLNNERGFILPLSMMLVLVLTASGLGFMQLRFVEQKLTGSESENHASFYLANAGIERARESFKIPIITGNASWTTVLDASATGHPVNYPTDTTPDPDLCPVDGAGSTPQGCVIPPFEVASVNAGIITNDGDPVKSPDFPFTGTFNRGIYKVRAFNNGSAKDSGLVDGDKIITVKALAEINGSKKILQVDLLATSGVKMLNCRGAAGADCPTKKTGNPILDPMPGREPASSPDLPTFDHAYYQNPANFPGPRTVYTCASGITCANGKMSMNIVDDGFYFIDVSSSKVEVNPTGDNDNVVIFSYGDIEIKGKADLTNIVIVSLKNIRLNGDITLRAPLPYPVLVAGDTVKADNSVAIYGTIYATNKIDFNPIQIHGVLISDQIEIQGSTKITDDKNEGYYDLMPGFSYPDSMKTTKAVSKTWQEVQ